MTYDILFLESSDGVGDLLNGLKKGADITVRGPLAAASECQYLRTETVNGPRSFFFQEAT